MTDATTTTPEAGTATPAPQDAAPAAPAPSAAPPAVGNEGASGTVLSQQNPTTDGQAPADGGDTTTNDSKGPEGDTEAAAVVEFDLTPPEGMEGFAGDFEAFTSDVREWMGANPKATPADALKWAAERQAAAVLAQHNQVVEAANAERAAWLEAAKADPEFGGDRFDENISLSIRGLKALQDDGLAAKLDASGLGNHPFILRALHAVGRQASASPVLAPAGAGARKTFAASLYSDS